MRQQLSPSFAQRIRWELKPRRATGYEGRGTLAGRKFHVAMYANGNPTSSAYKVRVTVDGRTAHRSGHVGGIGAAQRQMRDLIRETVATARGDSFPGVIGY